MKPLVPALRDYFGSRYPKDEPGFAVAVLKGGRTIFQDGFGTANLATREPITPRTRFPIGSNSKLFTAAMLYLLEADGKLKVSDPVLKHLPYLPAYFKPLRLSHFIHHSSGLSIPGELRLFMGHDPRRPNPPEQGVVPIFRRLPGLQAKPGTSFLYNSSPYTLMAKVVEKVGGSPFEEQVEARLFKPLGMMQTRLPTPRRLQGRFMRARSYEKISTGPWLNADGPVLYPGPCFVMSPLEDIVTFVKRLREPGAFAGLFRSMLRPGWRDPGGRWSYGGGLYVDDYPRTGGSMVYHGGIDGAFHSWFWWLPGRDLGLVLLGNREDFWPWQHFEPWLDIMLRTPKRKKAPPKPALPADAPAAVPLKPGFYRSVEDGGKELWQFLPGPGRNWTVRAGWGEFQVQPWQRGAFLGLGVAKGNVLLSHAGADGPLLGEFKQGKLIRTLKPLQSGPVRIRHADFLGRYYCRQILRHYTVKKHVRGLRLRMPPTGRPRHEEADGRLQWLGGDRFMAVLIRMLQQGRREARGELVFKRDRRGRVSGFTVKIENLWMKLKELEFKKRK